MKYTKSLQTDFPFISLLCNRQKKKCKSRLSFTTTTFTFLHEYGPCCFCFLRILIPKQLSRRSEGVVCIYSSKQTFLKILQNIQEDICVGVSFIKKILRHRCLSVKYVTILRTAFLNKSPPMVASLEVHCKRDSILFYVGNCFPKTFPLSTCEKLLLEWTFRWQIPKYWWNLITESCFREKSNKRILFKNSVPKCSCKTRVLNRTNKDQWPKSNLRKTIMWCSLWHMTVSCLPNLD